MMPTDLIAGRGVMKGKHAADSNHSNLLKKITLMVLAQCARGNLKPFLLQHGLIQIG